MDLISKQMAIDLWEKYHPTIAVDAMQYDAELRQLPSAQPEPLTDKEQRIFLAAMEREKKVCKRVDEEWSDGEFGDLYETVNLERVCTEIERKVKGALWT